MPNAWSALWRIELPERKPCSRVSCMETDGDVEPGHNEARRMLAAAEGAEDGTRNPALPWTFFIAQAVLVAGVCAAQMLPASPSRAVTIVGLIAIVGVGMRKVFARPGYGVVWPDGRGVFPYMVALFVVVGIPAVLALGFDLPWLWLVAGFLAGATTLELGCRYRRVVGRV